MGVVREDDLKDAALAVDPEDFIESCAGEDKCTGVKLAGAEVMDACIIRVMAGTNCPQGGDAGHGGRTIVLIQDLSSVAMDAEIDGELHEGVNKIRLVFSGDAECRTLIEGLKAAVAHLESQHNENQEKNR